MAMQIDIEAQSYRWSTKRHVHSNSVDWSFMNLSTKTEKTLTITRENLQTQDVIVYGMWYGTPPNHDDPVRGEEIKGKFTVTELFDDGECSYVETKVFSLFANASDDNTQRIIAFGRKDMPMSLGSTY